MLRIIFKKIRTQFCGMVLGSILLILVTIFYFIFINNNKTALTTTERLNSSYKEQIDWIATHTEWYQQGSGLGWAGFDKVYFIAMPDRLDNVHQVAERLGITNSAWILKAINKDTLNITELLKQNIVAPEYLHKLVNRGYGVIGCELSHLAALLDCLRDPKVQTCVIFEDDLYKPAKAVTAQISEFSKRVAKQKILWDILYMDYCYETGGGRVNNDIRRLKSCFCAHAYVVNKRIIPQLISEAMPLNKPYDYVLEQLIRDKTIFAIGPNKARYFSQNRRYYGSALDPNFVEYEVVNSRYYP